MSTPFPPLKGTKLWHNTSYPAIDPSRSELNAKGKTLVVGGGGTGVGAAIVKAFAAAGAPQIAIFGRRRNVLETTKGEIEKAYPATHVSIFTADVTKAAEVDTAFDHIARQIGKIDVFVSCSGFLSTPNSIASSDIDDWWMSMDVNVKGALFTARAFLRHAAKDAYLLNINSGVAHMPAVPMGISAYAVTKAAAAKLYDYVGAENPELHVVTIQPGVVETYAITKAGCQLKTMVSHNALLCLGVVLGR